MSVAVNGRTTDGMGSVAVGLDARAATSAEGHGGAVPWDGVSGGVHDLDVTANHQRATRRDRYPRRSVSGGRGSTFCGDVHESMMSDAGIRRCRHRRGGES